MLDEQQIQWEKDVEAFGGLAGHADLIRLLQGEAYSLYRSLIDDIGELSNDNRAEIVEKLCELIDTIRRGQERVEGKLDETNAHLKRIAESKNGEHQRGFLHSFGESLSDGQLSLILLALLALAGIGAYKLLF